MIDVDVSIAAIVMCCDESICNVNFGKGYKVEKCSFDSLFFKDKGVSSKMCKIINFTM